MQVPIPTSPYRRLVSLFLMPSLMCLFYMGAVYELFYKDPLFLSEHLIIFAFWTFNTVFLMFLCREALIRLHIKFISFPAVILPTVSWFLLYCIYVCSLVGNYCWGANFGYHRFLRLLPYLFTISDNFNIPRALILAVIILPIAALMIIYVAGIREIVIWHYILKEKIEHTRQGRRWFAAVVLAWFLGWVYMASADPTLRAFGNFSYDPVVVFFKGNRSPFPMTKERVFEVQKDMQAKKLIRYRVPRVHNVFVFLVDALRCDHLPLYGYPRPLTPFLSRFWAQAHCRKIDWGLSNGIETGCGLLCLFTSKEPLNFSYHDLMMTDLFANQGFETSLILSADHRRMIEQKAFGRKVDFIYDGADHPGPNGIFDDELVPDEVANLKPDDGGFHFFYIHLFSVHQVGYLNPKYLRYTPARNFIEPQFTTSYAASAEDLQDVANMYDDRILQMDDVMRKIMASLKQKGYLKDYVAVFTGDHGQLLGEKGKFGHGYFAPVGGMHLPMVFFGSKPLPDFPETRYADQIDIAPTLADLAGIQIPGSWQGQSLLRKRENPWSFHLSPTERPGEEGAVVYYTPQGILKFNRLLKPSAGDPGRLYDLDKDPLEQDDLASRTDPALMQQFRAQAAEHFTEN